ncbi:uncharacterized protein LOC112547989 [Alligator sinensis]|uniref:Uncharacterized protein LOC112547989 n=1 Tax=Alligator sinensis TaxID=38654 RepID=A0A3Q0FN00_ALLSI|nr:uncharacterized protein LOC112547989 [Alligator sinensis]
MEAPNSLAEPCTRCPGWEPAREPWCSAQPGCCELTCPWSPGASARLQPGREGARGSMARLWVGAEATSPKDSRVPGVLLRLWQQLGQCQEVARGACLQYEGLRCTEAVASRRSRPLSQAGLRMGPARSVPGAAGEALLGFWKDRNEAGRKMALGMVPGRGGRPQELAYLREPVGPKAVSIMTPMAGPCICPRLTNHHLCERGRAMNTSAARAICSVVSRFGTHHWS